MWARLVFCFLVIAAAGAEHRAWQVGKQYDYKISGRTLAALHDVSNEYNGVLLKAKLRVQPEDEQTLNARVVEAQQAEIHQSLPGGWGSQIDKRALSWKPLELTQEPFQIVMENGVVRRLIVSSKLPTSEVNLIKGLVSQLQVDTKGENMIRQNEDDLPAEENPSGVYNVMEDAVTGKCEVQYDISELPKYQVQSRPEIVPMPQLAKNGQVIDVVKTSNFSNCANRPEYHFGLNGLGKFKPASAKMGQFFARSSISRVVLTGNVNKYTIQSAVTTHKTIISPALYNTQKGMVVSRTNMTLIKIESAQSAPQAPTNPIAHQSLVYKYESEAMKKLSREAREVEDQESSVEITGAAKDFHKSLKRPSAQDEDVSFEQAAYLPEDLDQSVDMLLHPNYAFPEAMNKQKVYTNIVELAKQIGQELQSAEAIQSEATLAKFNVLAALVRSARTSELKRITQELYSKDAEEKTPAQVAAWKAFRDAVAEAGTGPALLTLKDWIMNDLVQGEEAAELIAALPRSARHPTNKYIQALFELATNQKVKQQQYLNTTAVLAFGDLVRLAQVDEKTMHSRYPSHIFGRLNPKEGQAVVRDYIPYFKNALKRAVQNHDSHRIQTYTHVLGNIAHPKIVDVFEPYLSGKVHMTNYQRQAMVHALDKLVESYPRIARAALLKIYQNVADAPQVRAIAVIYLMKTNPPAALLQRMSESVKDEQNPHIRSIVKTAIEAAAQLNAWDNWELKTHAKSAESMLNQTDSNAHLSQLHIKSNDVKNTPALSYFTSFATIGSQDSVLPRTIFMKLRQNLADLKFELQGFGVMTSSIEEIINSIANKFEASKAWKKQHSTPYKTSHGFSIEDVLSEMNIARDHAEPIEANLLLRSLADKRFFTMDNQTIQQLPYEFQKVAEELRQGKSFNYTKLYNQYTVAMSFPTATGFPFFYSLSAPTLLSVGGKARVVMHPQPTADKIRVPETMNATLDIHVIASSKVQAQLGFVNPLTLNRYTAGLDKDMQIHVPVLAQVDVEVQKKQENRQQVEIRTRIQPSESDESFPIVNLRSKPYLAKQSLLKAAPQEQHAISVRKPFQTRFTVGQDLTGMAFRVEAATEMKFVDFASLYKNAKKHDFISAMTFFTNEDSIHNYNLKMSFDHEKSTAKSVELTAAFETHSKKTFDVRETYPKEDQDNLIQPLNAEVLRNTVSAASEDDTDAITPQTFKATPTNPARNLAKPQDKSANSQERRTEFLKKASKSIQDADAVVVDLSATFKGQSRAEFVATAAAAQSEVSDNTRVLLYLRKKSADQKEKQFAMAAESDVPRVPLSNFVSALKSQPDILVMTAIAFGEEIDSSASQIDAVAFLHRSRSQREHVRKSAMGKLCVEQMHKGNNHLPACQNATLEASKLNSYYLDIAYDRISEQVKNATYKAYSLARDFGWEFNTENLIGVQNQPKKIHLKARFEPNYQAVNVSIAAPQLNSHFENVRLNRWVRAAVVVHPTFSPVGMLAREALNRDQYPQCNIGQSAINTFSNKTFPVKMGRNWHAVLVSAYKKNSASQEYQDLVVLVRDTTSSEHQKEVIVLSGPNVIELTYARDFARVNVNGKTIKMSDKHTNVFSDGHDNAWAMLYGRPDGSVKIVLPIHKVKMLYDRTNLAISAGSQLREQMRGLCGKFNDVDADDFTVPRNCVVKHPKDFAASYIVRPTGNAANEQQQAKEAHCIPKMYNFGVQRRQSDDEYAPAQRRQSEESAESQESGRSSGCVSYKTKTVEHDGKMCFSKRPQPSCNSSCRPTQEIERNVEFVCIGDRDLASQYQRQIRSGSVPSQITRSSTAKKLSVKVPETCRM